MQEQACKTYPWYGWYDVEPTTALLVYFILLHRMACRNSLAHGGRGVVWRGMIWCGVARTSNCINDDITRIYGNALVRWWCRLFTGDSDAQNDR